MATNKIAKKLPKRVGRGPGAWAALHNARAKADRAPVVRDARRGINYPHIGDVGSAAYRRRGRR